MSGNKVLLDTNVIIDWLKGSIAIAEKLEDAAEVIIPTIVIGELYYGAFYSKRTKQNINDILEITSNYKLLPVDENTPVIYGKIKADLRKAGKPIPENDIWIAALAHQHNLMLITADNHFKAIPNLHTNNWQ